MLVSIVIACLNCSSKLRHTLASIALQVDCNVEVLIIDGGSTDDLLVVLEEFATLVSYWISEPDKGISDAFNKGVAQATGDYLYFIGAGDTFYQPDVLSKLTQKWLSVGDELRPDLICGRVARCDTANNVHAFAPKTWPRHPHQRLLKYLIYPHQGLLMHRSYFVQYGYFDTRLRFAMDYELLVRSYRDKLRVCVDNVVVAYWQDDGVGVDCTDAVLREYHLIRQWHQLASPFMLWCLWKWQLAKLQINEMLKGWSSRAHPIRIEAQR